MTAESLPTPPDGWVQFGTHAGDSPVPPLEFSAEVGEDGLPLWERPVPTPAPAERCPVCGSQGTCTPSKCQWEGIGPFDAPAPAESPRPGDMTALMMGLRDACITFIQAWDDHALASVDDEFTDLLDAASKAATEWGRPFTDESRPWWNRQVRCVCGAVVFDVSSSALSFYEGAPNIVHYRNYCDATPCEVRNA